MASWRISRPHSGLKCIGLPLTPSTADAEADLSHNPASASSQDQEFEDPDADFDHFLQEPYGLTVLQTQCRPGSRMKAYSGGIF